MPNSTSVNSYTYINVSDDDTVSMSVQEVFAFRISTQNQRLASLSPGQGSKQGFCQKEAKSLIKSRQNISVDDPGL